MTDYFSCVADNTSSRFKQCDNVHHLSTATTATATTKTTTTKDGSKCLAMSDCRQCLDIDGCVWIQRRLTGMI